MIKEILYILIIIGVCITGLSIGFTLQGTSILEVAQSVKDSTQPVWQPIQMAWLLVPEQWRGIIIGGVPGLLLTGFLAWTKIRAMNKLEEVTKQVNQLEGEKTVTNQLITNQTKQITKLQNQSEGTVSSKLKEANQHIQMLEEQLKQKISTINRLHKKIDQYEIKVQSQELDIKILNGKLEELTRKLLA